MLMHVLRRAALHAFEWQWNMQVFKIVGGANADESANTDVRSAGDRAAAYRRAALNRLYLGNRLSYRAEISHATSQDMYLSVAPNRMSLARSIKMLLDDENIFCICF